MTSRKSEVLDSLKAKNVQSTVSTAKIFRGPTTARTVSVPITGFRPAIPFFGGRLRGPIFGTPVDVETGDPVPELTVTPGLVFGDTVTTSKKITQIRLSYDVSYTRVPAVNNPLPAGPVLSYIHGSIFNFNNFGQIAIIRAMGIPNVNTWRVSLPIEYYDMPAGSTISFFSSETFPPGSTVALTTGADPQLFITFAY